MNATAEAARPAAPASLPDAIPLPLPERLTLSREALFWALHVGGWLSYAIAQTVGAWMYDKPIGHLRVLAVLIGAGFVISTALRYVYRPLWGRPIWTVVAGVLASCYVAALLWRLCINYAWYRFVEDEMNFVTLQDMFGGVIVSSYVMLCWSSLYFGIKFYEGFLKEREATLKAAALAQEAQLRMLRYQLNPHFLFNTLNAISTLILDNQNRTANHAVTRLSDFLRYTLDQDPMKKVTVRQELDALNMYLNTERLRFGERLRLEFAVEDAALGALVPSLLLQPLIENAVKYAVSPREDGGTIRVEGRVRDDMLELVVADDGPGLQDGMSLNHGCGVGLRNTRERLAVLYGPRHRFAALDAQPGVRVEIALPLERAQRP
jgi:hypothetical protein